MLYRLKRCIARVIKRVEVVKKDSRFGGGMFGAIAPKSRMVLFKGVRGDKSIQVSGRCVAQSVTKLDRGLCVRGHIHRACWRVSALW